jgi:hypothetical protein
MTHKKDKAAISEFKNRMKKTKAFDVGAFLKKNPEIIRDEIDREILNDLRKFPITKETTTISELAEVLKVGYAGIIKETDDWRPLAQHVMNLMLAVQLGVFKIDSIGKKGLVIKEVKKNPQKKDTFEARNKRRLSLGEFVDKVMAAVNEVGCIHAMVVEDNSKISDFLYEAELEELQCSLNLPVAFNDYVVDVAQRLKYKKSVT